MLKWLVLLCAVLYVTAQDFQYEVNMVEAGGCCTPNQWEGYLGQLVGYTRFIGRGRVFADGVQLSYDAKNKRLAETIYLRDGRNSTKQIRLIFNFNEKKVYRFVEAEQKCRVRSTKMQFRPFCIPANATKLGTFYYGAGTNQLRVTSYNIRVPRMRVEAFAQVTATGCIPVSETILGSRRLTQFMAGIGFANITPNIKDPKVFNPPSYCQEGYENESESYEDTEHLNDEWGEFMVQYIHQKMIDH